MGNCIFCGHSAGIMRKSHNKCNRKHEQGKLKIISLVGKGYSKNDNLDDLQYSIEKIAKNSFVDAHSLKSLVASGWENAVSIALEDGLLSEQEESSLCELKDHFSLSQQELDKNGAYSNLAKGAVLREIMKGNVPDRMKIEGA